MSLVKVEVERSQVDSVRTRVFGEGADSRTIYQQKIWVYKSGSKHPTEYEIQLPDGVKLYESGSYVVDLQANMERSKYGSFSFGAFLSTKLYPVNQNFIDNLDKMENALYDQLHKVVLQAA